MAQLTGQDIRDLVQAQALIAGELAARAADDAFDAQVGELRALHHELIAAAAAATPFRSNTGVTTVMTSFLM